MTPFMTEDFLLDTELPAVCIMIMRKTSLSSITIAICRHSKSPKTTGSRICMTSG
ncbi:Uncharacterised protein [Citrobacter amalonaticus]|nr:Uncharacterised protein [Citrobacter amalonaticus]